MIPVHDMPGTDMRGLGWATDEDLRGLVAHLEYKLEQVRDEQRRRRCAPLQPGGVPNSHEHAK